MCKNWTIRIKNNENRFSSFSFFPLNSLLKTFFTPIFRFDGIHDVPLSQNTKFSGVCHIEPFLLGFFKGANNCCANCRLLKSNFYC